jgi:hypothetical protein
MREIPHFSVALYEVAVLFGTLVAETILASVHVRAHKQAGHMDASDLIKTLPNTLQGGAVHIWKIGTARRDLALLLNALRESLVSCRNLQELATDGHVLHSCGLAPNAPRFCRIVPALVVRGRLANAAG